MKPASYTIKIYNSEKKQKGGVEVNFRIILKADTNAFGYKAIVIEDGLEEVKVVGGVFGGEMINC